MTRPKRRQTKCSGTEAPAARPAERPSLHPTGACTALAAAGVSLGALGVYVATLAPTVTFVDSGELIVAAHGAGVAHPPGTPLYVLLAHLATLVPLGRVTLRVNAASAVFAALAAAGVVLAARELLLGLELRGGAATPPRSGWLAAAPLACAGLAFAFSRSLWSFATVAEVYGLNTLLIVAALALVLRWRRGGGNAWLTAAGVVVGAALGVHHVTVALCVPALLVLAWTRPQGPPPRGALLASAVGLAAAVVSVYAYLPLAAARRPLLNWGDPSSLERFVAHVTGRQYQVYFELSARTVVGEAASFLRLAARQFGPPWLPAVGILALAGLAWLWGRDRGAAAALLVLAAANLAFGLVYVIGEDKEAYYLPSFLAVGVAAAAGSRWLLERAASRPRAAAAALLLVPAVPLAAGHPYADRSRQTLAEDYVEDVLATVEPGSLVLTSDWQLYSPWLYLREVEGLRRDAVPVDVHLLRRSWYFDLLRRQAPALLEAAGPETSAFLADLRRWERDPRLYERETALRERINERFLALVSAFAGRHAGRVYATADVVLPQVSPDPVLARALAAHGPLVPQGLVFDLSRRAPPLDPPPVPLRARGLFDGSVRFEANDVAALKVRPAYLGMMVNRGLYLAGQGRREEALGAIDAALDLDPSFGPARRARNRVVMAGRGVRRRYTPPNGSAGRESVTR